MGRERSPAHRAEGATAPALRGAEQGAGQSAKPCPPRPRRNSSRPSRSGAGSRSGGEALPTAPQAQQLPPFAERSREPGQKAKPCPPRQRRNSSRPSRSGAGSRSGGEALPVMVPLKLGRDRRCQAEDPATKRSHVNRHIARSHPPPVNKAGVQRAEPSGALPRKGGFGWVRATLLQIRNEDNDN
ncbi:hypothetical protein B2I21_13075 [Chryseobacterium mucoviscidosis]|nr:hypothetical protein B2I21_13075 [Chryseobacterium mucoviscidosis]